jgi:hypothetical protein
MPRSLHEIAIEISSDWKKISPYAKPYLEAMYSLSSIEDAYYADSGRSVVAYFLSNAAGWRGEVAKRIKQELNMMLKGANQ